MTTPQKDRQFIDDMIDHNLLEKAIDWIARHYDPEDVFDEDTIMQWVQEHCKPNAVLGDDVLEEWARGHGMEDKP